LILMMKPFVYAVLVAVALAVVFSPPTAAHPEGEKPDRLG